MMIILSPFKGASSFVDTGVIGEASSIRSSLAVPFVGNMGTALLSRFVLPEDR